VLKISFISYLIIEVQSCHLFTIFESFGNCWSKMGLKISEFHEVPSCFICKICSDVMEDPVGLRCRHYFCVGCVRNLLYDAMLLDDGDLHADCVECQEPFMFTDVFEPPKWLSALYRKELKKKCPFWPQCQKEIAFDSYVDIHSASCEFNPINRYNCDKCKFLGFSIIFNCF